MAKGSYTKIELLEVLKQCNDKLIAVDMDGTLCDGEWWGDGEQPKQRPEIVALVTKLYRRGAHIIIYTARQPNYYALTHAWLIANLVPFHGICMTMKPGADIYIDDKAIHPEEVLSLP